MDIIEKTIGDVDVDNIMLPVGLKNEEGIIKRFCTINELTGEAEETIADPKLKDNAGKIITALLGAILDTFEGKKVNAKLVRDLTTVDRDFVIVMMHKISFGNDVKWVDECPHCKELNKITIDIDSLKVRYLPTEYPNEFSFKLPKPMQLPGMDKAEEVEISIIIPNGWVQERIAPIGKSNPAQATTALIQQITTRLGHLEMPIENDIFKKMPSKNRLAINNFLGELNLGVNTVVDETCAVCGESFSSQIPMSALLGE